MNDQNKHHFFTENLLHWHASHHRPLPWKGERNPYLIWLSEIILQQTRVEQGLPYFEKFKRKYPTVQDLAAAPEDEVMKLWEGLGYYSRARNLHAAAKFIAHDLGGIFPNTFESIRSLKGVGDYTASAIASFAFDLPFAVVDGNVYRVLARFFGIDEAVDTTAGKRIFAELAQALLDKSQPGKYNQAIMDFGATHCTPAAPKCPTCPLRPECVAFQTGSVAVFPVKSKKLERRTRFFNYLIFNQQDCIFLKKRTGKDIWQNLYDFPLIETEGLVEDKNELLENPILQAWLGGASAKLLTVSQPFRQELSHQKIIARFLEIEIGNDFSAAG
ncbi:MAG: A/G-specific adenine glycosylase, partial [Bacteroidota bacterium]